MTKQEQIEEMANIPHKCIKSSCEECIKNDRKCADYTRAEAIYNAGYRKADEVRKETAREILNELIDSSNKITFFDCRMALGLDKLAKKYGLEIKE